MDLIQSTKKVKEKENSRNKILGQREMLIDSLKNLGYKTIGEAKKSLAQKKNALIKMETHYNNGEEKFKTEFAHLLQ